MRGENFPQAKYAIIGGSSTNSINFPQDVAGDRNACPVLEEKEFDTPYGKSPLFKLFEYKGKKVLTCKMHGWRKGVTRADSSLQVFYVLQKAGVKKILSEGGVGSLNTRFKPRDLIIPDDFVDLTVRRNLVIDGSHLLIMREAFCPTLRSKLIQTTVENTDSDRVFEEGVYVCTDGNRFETKAEIKMMKNWGDIIGQSMAPEASLARDIGACFASVQIVVNYAEGIVEEWDYGELKDIFYSESKTIGSILLKTLDLINEKDECICSELRKKTLLN